MLEERQFASGSRRLVVFNRHTGKLLWKRDAVLNFRHNNISVSEDMIFCTDAITEGKISKVDAEVKAQVHPTLYALDLKTGSELWKTSEEVFGTFFNYSAEHDILLQAGSKYRDRAKDEVGKGMIAYRGTTGKVLWENHEVAYSGPCLLWRDRIITNGDGGFSLDLLTGKKTGWSYQRMYGCNTAIGSENLLTFRSGAAGFYDMEGDSGTGNIGGFRSSCTNNLIVANGVLNAPDYTRTCSCAYQNQTSLALVHMPDAEFWTFGAKHAAGRVGVNFGAPGDRRDPEGTLWTEFPSVGGPSDEIKVTVAPSNSEIFRLHSSSFSGEGLKWVAASGIMGAETISIPVSGTGLWKVHLSFAEPEEVEAGERVMNVRIQNKSVLTDFDIAKVSGGVHRLLTREFEVEAKDGKITIELKSTGGLPTLISGVELVRK
jgi:outer membrane protein assembly factor BamB